MKKWLFLVLIAFVLVSLLINTNCAREEKIHHPMIYQPPEVGKTLTSEIAALEPNDPSFDKQWALAKMRVPQAWQITSGCREVIVAVLDTGIDQKHEDLKGKVVASVNFGNSKTIDDIDGHGTHTAGIIAANTNNKLGIAGIAPNARILSVKVTTDTGLLPDSDALVKGIIWAVDKGAEVINIGLTYGQPSSALEEATDYAWNHGVLVVAAASDLERPELVYPARYQNCLAVASTDADDSLSFWVKRSDWTNVLAPGENIYSTLPNDSYGHKSGDSFAAAQVSGIAALLFAVVTDKNNDSFLNDEVSEILENNQNRIDAFEAVVRGADR